MRMHDFVLVDVDTQFDFLDPGGDLYIPGAARILPALERLFDFARRSQVPVISTADEHGARDPEFERFGRHCEAGTLGQRKLVWTVMPRSRVIRPADSLPAGPAPLLDEYQQLIFHKADIDVFVNPHLGALVDTLLVGEYIVFGVATDYCVATMVEGLLRRGAKVSIVADAVAAIDEARGEAMLREFETRGVELTRTAWVVHSVDLQEPALDRWDED